MPSMEEQGIENKTQLLGEGPCQGSSCCLGVD